MAEPGKRSGDQTAHTEQRNSVKLMEELRRSNAALRSETEMLERHLSRLDPRPRAPEAETEASPAAPHADTAAGHGWKLKARTAAQERLQRLTVEQKCEVAQKELDEMRGDLQKLKATSERVLNNYRATLEEADIHLVEIKKANNEFDRHIAKAFREKSGILMGAEKVVRYLDRRMRAKDALVEKLRLKNADLKVQKRKLQMQLQEKEELDEALHEVDFQQLKIENSQYLEHIDERNQDLLCCKLTAGKALQVLNSHKKKLQSMMDESKLLSSDIAARRQILGKIEAETVQAEKERSKAEALNQRLRSQLEKFHVPHVLEYVTAKTTHSELEQNVRAWERKVEISEMVLKTHTKAWNKLRMSTAVAPVMSQ
ncbi:cilia- and flagella-associated protein 263 isoform X1 [Scleropages formosus]|uniref:Cilia- and flagella-associated protein 263 n=2 Tax=Scleropages formosus TaxID=113540 RepID=A0A8C9VJX9_SCLFO|nr:coiled-coil domain-containing protein 113 isoform X1 [Scleropages formosus]